ncbi:phenylalanine--tRNA ligase subunit beta [Gramella sp. AN32]|uniref:Phenylalanine--tRNA ligase beta subunit n=1 Tax=Christiangramia antarctica TaxID=2058158 RepID=A0ABW5X7C4_9FLAO|nr:phenylalanine--tRNA ligase subunit beta [Gramella sp. AN32]MCM4154604.1 phenylalanine--tRNA ligase subunit beta [Gramella sp. AN32]
MKISYNWLKQFIKLPQDAEETGKLLTNLGLEVEGIKSFSSVKGGLKGVLVGHVLECKSHPNADRLNLTKIELGNGEAVQIVCGAPNIATGQKVPVATIGTMLYDENGESWEIKKGKIRGESSYGMICSEKELGLGESHEGIMVMDKNLVPGKPVADLFEVENDEIFEIGLTPNRADAMSHWGVARDLKAGYQQNGKNLELITPSVSSFHTDNRSLKIQIKVEDSNLAPRYCGVTLSDLKIEDSPEWLKNRLKAIGINPKNNVVDATNYVMHELGQPLHAFDAAKIAGNEIQVKTLKKGSKFTTLDEVERELSEEDLMICDAEKPLCIAGVFGGLNSGVTKATTSIFLESAYFNPVSVRKTAKRHGLNTDASFRFERGIDINSVEYALRRAALLIKEVAGGEITSDVDDLYFKKIEDFQVFLTFEKVNKLIGENLAEETIKSILASLDIRVNNITETGMGLTIPSFRVDVQRESDVIEEILRVYGYNNIKVGDKLSLSVANSSKFEDYKIQNLIAVQLVGQGFYETMANSLTTPTYNKLSEDINAEYQVEMLNPLSQDLSVLRQSLLYSGLETISYNINRKRRNIKIFEFGKTYHSYSSGRIENKHLSLFTSGPKKAESWTENESQENFFYAKGVINSVFQKVGITSFSSKATKSSVLSEGIEYNSKKSRLVEFGTVKKSVLKHFDIDQEVIYADFNWEAILELLQNKKKIVTSIPKYPSSRRDFALLLDEKVNYAEIETIALQTEKKLLKEVNLFDVYQGKNLPEGKKSYAVSFIFQDENKTLTDKQVDKLMSKLQYRFEQELNAELR